VSSVSAERTKSAERYERHKRYLVDKARRDRAAAAEISPIPEIVDPERRESCKGDLKLFCETYMANAFYLAWSQDQLRVLSKIEATVLRGGLFALAMPRGCGKTTLTVAAAVWALLYGHRRWVVLIGATITASKTLLDDIKSQLLNNDLLLQDFPRVVYPLRKIGGSPQRTITQTCDGVLTQSAWNADRIVFPTITGSDVSGSRVTTATMTGHIRGPHATLASGEVIRPDYVVPDDPQTRASALSREQTTKRMNTINGDVLGLAGPGVAIAGIVPCTVIIPGDLSDQLLDNEANPLWRGTRTQLVNGLPKNMKLWEEYFAILNAETLNEGTGEEATAFYQERQAEMDEGCIPTWPAALNVGEVSAVQHAMNLFNKIGPVAWWAEYMNAPQLETGSTTVLSRDEIMKSRVGKLGHCICPQDTHCITAMVDCHKELLYYCVTAWAKDMTGTVIDYGTFPDQRTKNFAMNRAHKTLSKKWPRQTAEARLQLGLAEITNLICEQEYVREDGVEQHVARILVDCNWEQDTVLNWCKHAKHRSVITPRWGLHLKATDVGLNVHKFAKRRPGRKIGLNWRIDKISGRPMSWVLVDVNWWKSFVHQRLATEPGASGSLTLYKAGKKDHFTFISHLTAQYPKHVEGVRKIDEWTLRPGESDDHWFDCLVGTAVAASMHGCTALSYKRVASQEQEEQGEEDQDEKPQHEKKPQVQPKSKPKRLPKVRYF
jgi:hypothetical protein